ncbi:MAG: type II toxin-antitoxin system PemK/MazF family toxin [Dorea sp.]|nr:type II toxin-antitoxin system PemK/MazF family toxin [Dorea sp.]
MSKTQEYRRGFIYLANLNPIKGSEEGGTRPVLVISNNNGNHHSSILIVAPITTRGSHRMMLTHVKLQRRVKTLDGPAYVMLEQIRVIDKVRILDYLGSISQEQMADVEIALLISLGLLNIRIISLREKAVEKLKRLRESRKRIRNPDEMRHSNFRKSSNHAAVKNTRNQKL